MPYQVKFTDSETFNNARQALEHDLKQLGLPPLAANKRITIDEKNQSFHFAGSSMELGVLFGDLEHSKTAGFIPFNGQNAPTQEEFAKVAKTRGIKNVEIIRAQGNIEESYKAERENAEKFFSEAVFPQKPGKAPDADAAFAQAIKSGKNIVINEAHGEQAHLRYLTERIPKLAGTNRSLLLEHFFKDQQPLLDEYMHSPQGSAMPPELAVYVDRFIDPKINNTVNKTGKNGHVYSTRELIETAKKHGVPVIAIETEEAFSARSFKMANKVDGAPLNDDNYGTADRMLLMNHNAAVISENLKKANPASSVITLAGASHGTDFKVENPGRETPVNIVPGLGKILGAPTIFPTDNDSITNMLNHIVKEMKSTGKAPSYVCNSMPHNDSDFTITLDPSGKPHAADVSSLKPLSLGVYCPAENNFPASQPIPSARTSPQQQSR
jgi:hypothetical protein